MTFLLFSGISINLNCAVRQHGRGDCFIINFTYHKTKLKFVATKVLLLKLSICFTEHTNTALFGSLRRVYSGKL